MSNLQNVRIPEGQVIVPMNYNQLKELMCECVELTIESLRKEEKANTEQKWYSSTEVSKMFGCSLSTINRWKKSGYLTARTLGGKDFFSIDEINNLRIIRS